MVLTMNTVQKNKDTFYLAEIVYLLYFSVMTLAKGFGLYDGMRPYTMALYAGAVLIVLKLILTEHTVAEWIYVLSMLALGILIYHNSGQTGALIYLSMITAMKNVSVKRLFKLGLAIWSSTFVLQILLTLTGCKNDIFMVHEKLGLGHIIRWSLGQPHPNVLQITALMICAMILYLTRPQGKKLLLTTFIMLLANLYIFFYSISYTGLILVVFYLSLNLYLSYRKKLSILENIGLNLVFPACVAFAVLGPVTFPLKLWNLCEKVLNTRFSISMFHLTEDPLTFFGSRPASELTIRFQNIDNSYVFALMRYGIVFFTLMCAAYMAYIWHCTRQRKYPELAITLGLAVAAIAEPFFVNPSFKNISLLFVGDFIFAKSDSFAAKYPDCFLNKKIRICSLGAKEISIPMTFIQDRIRFFFQALKEKAVLFTAVSLCAGILAGGFYAVHTEIPTRYYVLRTSTQIVSKEYILLDIQDLPEDFDGVILNYVDAETPMQIIEGNIGKVEYARGIVSITLWTALLTRFLLTWILALFKSLKSKPTG